MFWRKTLIYKETIIVALIIAYLSLIKEPIIRLPENVAFADKWEHLLAYIVLGAVLVVDLWRAKVGIKCLWIVGLLVPILYGGLLEILQGAFCYPRTASWMDWMADGIGTIVGVSIVAGIWTWKH
jgi:VanZ family protein